MATQPQSSARLVFGPFEVNVSASELRKRGVRVRLPGQPFQILLLLLKNRGDIVTREQLREQIWGAGTFVDFEHGLNVAMNKLRRALGDSAEAPRYIETVPGRGYRFMGSVQNLGTSGTSSAGLEIISGSGAVVLEKRQAKSRPPRRKWLIAIAACVAPVAMVIGVFSYLHRKPALTGKDPIVLADFTNTTGDPVFDGTLRQGLAVQLEQSPFLSLVSDQHIQKALSLMGQPAVARLTSEVAREICERTASAAVLEGSIASLGSQYVLGLRARNCRTGDVLDEEQLQAARKEDVLNALSQMASRFRTRVGESLATVETHDKPLAEATTPSLEALKAYSAAWKVAFSTGYAYAIPHLKRAIELDPQFAMAHAFLGRVYADTGESVLSAEATAKAYQLRDRTSEREKFFITFSYDRQVTGNLEKAQQTLELWTQTYPRDIDAHSLYAGFATQGTGQYEKTIEEANKAIALDADSVPSFMNLASAYLYSGRPAAAEVTLHRAAERKLEIPDYLILRYYIAFLKGDQAGMEREITRARSEPGVEDWILHNEALVLAYSGRLQRANAKSRRAVDLAQQVGARERAALYEAGEASYEAVLGNAALARQHARVALALSKGRDIEYAAAFALALSGDLKESQTLAHEIDTRFPEDTCVRFSYLPTLRALFALAHGDSSKAIDLLQLALPYDMALTGTAFFGYFGGLYPAFVRGEAYSAANRGAEAATEFQKILDHRGLVFGDPIGALTHLQLARAFQMSGQTAKAKTGYQDFLTLWKDADPDIPVLKQAKSEYARLQ
jgi:DNA-binding winged helix-turn-helix (wHTH) protein/predicted Zn-dependent protease